MINKKNKRYLQREQEKVRKAKKWIKFFEKSKGKLNNLKTSLSSNKIFFSIDTEEHEFTKKILEIGITTYQLNKIESFHFIVKENYNLRNSKYVPDNKDSFNFGKSEIMNLDDIYKEVKIISDKSHYLVGHAVQNDLFFLESIGSLSFINTFDTQIYQKHLFQNKEEISLINLCKEFEIEPENLHNAGNDAYYTMRCLIKISEN